MKPRHESVNRVSTADDNWTTDASVILSLENASAIREALDRSPIIVEHRFYRGGSSPSRIAFDDYEDYSAYLAEHGRAGDIINVWVWEDVCNEGSRIVSGKCPDDDGYVPTKGGY